MSYLFLIDNLARLFINNYSLIILFYETSNIKILSLSSKIRLSEKMIVIYTLKYHFFHHVLLLLLYYVFVHLSHVVLTDWHCVV